MKKKLLCLLISTTLMVSVIGCNKKEEGREEISEKEIVTKQEVTKEVAQEKEEDEKVVEFNLSTPDPDSSSITVAAIEFGKKIEEKSQGSIKIKVAPNGTLYGADPGAAVKQLGAGSIDMLVLSTSLYANFEPRFNAISVPYAFDDAQQFRDYLNSDIAGGLLKDLSSMQIEGLGYWTRSFRQITNSVRPIQSPADLEGVKLRVPNNPLWVDYFKTAGAVPTPMAFGEVYNALQLKTIDGQENPVDVPLSAKFYEVQKYISISNHMADAWIVGINQGKFNELSEAQQKILKEVAIEMQEWKYNYDAEEDQKALDELKENGMEVNEVSADNQKLFVEVSQKLYEQFAEIVKDQDFFDQTMKFVGKK